MGVAVLFCPGVSLHPRNVESKHTRRSLAETGSTKLKNHEHAFHSATLPDALAVRGLSAAKPIRDLTPGRDVEEKGITAREETCRLSITDGTREVEIKEPRA